MAQTSWKTYDCELEWAKVFDRNMDEGGEENEAAKTVAKHGGKYSVDMIVDEETKQQMIADGIPEVSLGYQMFKDEGEGKWRYSAKLYRNKNGGVDKDGNPILRKPNVIDYVASEAAGEAVPWEESVNIGNGSKGKVKLRIYKNGNKRVIDLVGVAVTELHEYEPEGILW